MTMLVYSPDLIRKHNDFVLCDVGCRELGRQRSSIELDTPSVKPAQLQALEEALNDKIRDHVPVTLQLLSIDDPAVGKVSKEETFLLS